MYVQTHTYFHVYFQEGCAGTLCYLCAITDIYSYVPMYLYAYTFIHTLIHAGCAAWQKYSAEEALSSSPCRSATHVSSPTTVISCTLYIYIYIYIYIFLYIYIYVYLYVYVYVIMSIGTHTGVYTGRMCRPAGPANPLTSGVLFLAPCQYVTSVWQHLQQCLCV